MKKRELPRHYVEKEINENGVMVIAYLDAVKGEENKIYTKTNEAYVYTIGNHLKKRPELIVFCGPGENMPSMNIKQINETLKEAANLVLNMVDVWDTQSVKEGCQCQFKDGKPWLALDVPDEILEDVKNYMYRTIEFYQHKDFEVLYLFPDTVKFN